MGTTTPDHDLVELLLGLYRETIEGVLLTRPDGTILHANPAACQALGRTEAELVAMMRWQLVLDEPGLHALMRERKETGVAEGTIRLRHADGSLLPVQFTSALLPSADGAPRSCVIFRGLSERTAAEELEALQSATGNLPVGLLVVEQRPGGAPRIVTANAAYGRIVGLHGAAGLALPELRHQVFRPDRTSLVALDEWPAIRALRTGEPTRAVEYHVRRADGAWRVVSISAAPVGKRDGRPTLRSVSVLLDVTDEVSATAAVLASEARYHALVEEGADPFFLLDLEGRLLAVNRAACEGLGYRREALLGMRMGDVQPGLDPAALRQVRERIEAGRTGPVSGQLRRVDGSLFPVEVRFAVVVIDGAPLLMGLARDVTERMREQERLRSLMARLRAVREEEQARIARDLHDDLGQVLTALQLELSAAETLVEGLGAPDERAGPILDRLVAASELAATTVEAVQRLTLELRAETLEKLGLEAALHQELRLLARRSGLEILDRLEAGAPLPGPVARALYRIAQEALTNVARHARARRVEVRLGRVPGEVVLEVADDGGGLPPGGPPPGHYGVIGMEERARELGGTLTLSPRPGGGTLVAARVPLPAETAP